MNLLRGWLFYIVLSFSILVLAVCVLCTTPFASVKWRYEAICRPWAKFVLALLRADAAAQTARGAGLLHSRSTVAACAAHRYLLVRRYQLDQSLRTGLGAFTAAGTFRLVYDGYAVLHAERPELTGLHTGTKAQTAIITFPD